MISGLNSTGHEIGGTIGIAVFSTIAAGATGALGGAQAASGIATPSSQPGSSLVSRAWSRLPFFRRPVTSCRSCGSTPSAMPIH